MSNLLSRRTFCAASGVTAFIPSGASLSQEASASDTISKSNRFLGIGIDRKSGRAFIEEKGSGETWIWDWRNIRAADPSSFTREGSGLRPLLPDAITETPEGFQLRYEKSWGRFNCTVELAGPEVLFRFEPDVRYACEFGAIQFPPALRPASGSYPTFLDTAFGGRMHRRAARGQSFTLEADQCWMRYYALLGQKSALMSILEPGFDALLMYDDQARGSLDCGWVHTARLGSLQQVRTQRLRFVSSPSYVQIARAYRQYAMEQGFYRSLRQKLEDCPSLDKLFGAVLIMIGYLRDPQSDYIGAFRKLKERGVEKAYVYPVGYFNFNGSDQVYPGYRQDYQFIDLGPEVLSELRRLDYLFAPWIWLNEVVAGSPFLDSLTLRRADGSKLAGWRVGKVWWYASHEGRILEAFRQAAPRLRAKYTAAHFDVLNAGPCLESFGEWPYDRKMDAAYRNTLFAEFSAHDRVVGCEQNKDWAVPYKHFGTNKLPGPYGKDAAYWPVPLWQLAFHDAVMTSWWEHSTYNDPDLGHDNTGREIRHRMLLDILTGDLPSVCPVGRQVAWKNPGGADREMFDFRYRIDDPVTAKAIDAAVQVARFNSTHATDDLLSHEFLSEDAFIQETVYASGTRVRVRLPRDISDAGEFKIT
jgi:hypothetical protein